MLVEVAECVRSVVRATDIPCRFGGDEFAVILPESSRDDAELLADRIAIEIRGQKIAKIGALKISAGVAELRPEDTLRICSSARIMRSYARRTPARPGSSRADRLGQGAMVCVLTFTGCEGPPSVDSLAQPPGALDLVRHFVKS